MRSKPTLANISVEAQLDYFRRVTAPQAARARSRLYRALPGPLPVGGGAPQLPTTLTTLEAAFTANTYTTAQTIIGTKATGPFSADYFKTLGASWENEAVGIIGVASATTPTFAMGTYFGVVAGTITTLLNITPTLTTISGMANIAWYWSGWGHTRATSGATSTMLATGILAGQLTTAALTVAGSNQQYAVNATPPTAVTTDLSSTVFLDIKGTWGTSNAANSTTVNFYRLTSLSS